MYTWTKTGTGKMTETIGRQIAQKYIEKSKGVTTIDELIDLSFQAKQEMEELIKTQGTNRKTTIDGYHEAINKAFPPLGEKPTESEKKFYFSHGLKGQHNKGSFYFHYLRYHTRQNRADKPETATTPVPETTPETTQTPAKTTRKRTPKKEKSIMELLGLDTDTCDLINATMQQLNIDEKEFFTNAAKMYARAVRGGATRNETNLSTATTEELLTDSKYKTHTNRTEELATRAIRGIIKFNDTQPENDNKWAITASAIKQLIGGRDATIQAALSKFEPLINDHHKKIDESIKSLNPESELKIISHNRKKDKRKITDDINLSQLIPNGIE